MKKGTKIFLAVLGIFVVGLASFIFFYEESPLYLLAEDCPPLAFPMGGGTVNLTGFSGYNISDWGEPGVNHNGIDFVVNPHNWTDIVASADGKVVKIEEQENQYSNPPGMVMFTIYIDIARGWELKYVLEPMAVTEHEKQIQRDHIIVQVGDKVEEGDVIARLLCTTEDYCHLHFMVSLKHKTVCAYTYSSPAAQAVYEDLALTYNMTICCPNCDAPGCTQP